MAQDLEPAYRLTDENLKITNVAIKGYTKKTTSSFPKEEYYAFKVVAVAKYVKDPLPDEALTDNLRSTSDDSVKNEGIVITGSSSTVNVKSDIVSEFADKDGAADVDIVRTKDDDIVRTEDDKDDSIVMTNGGKAEVEDDKTDDTVKTKDDITDDIVKTKDDITDDVITTKDDKTDDIVKTKDDNADDVVKMKDGGMVKMEDSSTDGAAGRRRRESESQHRWEVWRRYSEFELLRNFLQSVYPHIVIPPLPEKKFQGNSSILNKMTTGEDFDFLTRRAQALEVFLLRVSRHPVLKENKWFHEFLYMTGWKECIVLSGYKEIAATESMNKSFFFSSSPKTGDSRFEDVKSYSMELECVLTTLLQIREVVNSRLKAVHTLHSDYAKACLDLSEIETTLGASLQAAAGNMDAYSDLIDVYLEEDELRYYLPLKEYQSYCESLRAVVRKQEMLQYNVEKCEKRLFNKADEKETLNQKVQAGGGGFSWRVLGTKLRGGDSSRNGIMDQVDSEIKEADVQLKQSQDKLDKFAEASMAELARFNTQKVSDFRSMLINYVQLQMHIHRQGMNIWERLRQAYETSSLRLT